MPDTLLRFDFDRYDRQGFREAVLAEGKTLEDLTAIIYEVGSQSPLLITRLTPEKYQACQVVIRDLDQQFVYNPRACILRSKAPASSKKESPREESTAAFTVAVLTAGTSDRNVAEEVIETLTHYEIEHRVIGDVGVAGVGRLLAVKSEIAACDCIICIAGMDGALASVVSGMFSAPVIGVPTSIGYGSSQGGTAALLSMLNSCAQGLCVMNIDNGFGAAMAAIRIRNLRNKNK